MSDSERDFPDINEIFMTHKGELTDFESYLSLMGDYLGSVINSFIPHSDHEDINRYLYDPLSRYSANGGKRHRPLICFAACAAVGGDLNRAVSSAAAIEHFHTAALIHDDIADEAADAKA